MKFLRNILEKQSEFVKKSPSLKMFYPVIEATDEFFFGTSKTTKMAPHIMDHLDIKRYMTIVVLGLLPSTIAGVYFYGLRVLLVIMVSYLAGGITEVIFSVIRRKPVYEGFLVTGLIFPLILPPSIPLWMVAVGSIFGVFFGKEVFGGTGRNVFNPALVGRVFISVAFPEQFASNWASPLTKAWGGFVQYTTDVVTAATPLADFKTTHIMTDLHDLFFGAAAGSIGETFRLGIIAGGLLIIFARIADWRIPLSYILSVGIFSAVMNHFSPDVFAPSLFQVLSGGLLFGAFFMATDPVSSPLTFPAKWIYGISLGVLTVLIRALSGFTEGVMFAILMMNALTPLIDSLVMGVKYKKIELSKA